MPAVIPFVITAVANYAGYELVGAVLAIAASAVISSYEGQKAKRAARDQYNAAQVDRFANIMTTTGPRELVLGRVRKGGTVAFRGSSGQFNQQFIAHIVLAAHEIDAVESIWFNDQQVTLKPGTVEVQDAPYVTVTTNSAQSTVIIPAGGTSVVLGDDPANGVTASVIPPESVSLPAFTIPVSLSGRTVTIAAQPYDTYINYQMVRRTPRAWVWWDLGAPGSGADGNTRNAFPDLWSAANRGEGIAKLIVMFDYDETAFPNGVPNVTAVIRGAKVYDPRTGLTAWSENPALLARHVYQHPNFGKATVSAAEDARFSAAANACDAAQTWVVDGVAQVSSLYHAGTVLPYGSTAASALDDLTQAMAGIWAFAQGELYIRAGAYTAPVITFGDADVASVQRSGDQEQQEKISIAVHRERAQKVNVMNVRIWDGTQDFKQVGLTPLKGAALIARDGQELPQELQLSAVSFAPQALHVAGVTMRDARDPLTVVVPLKMRAYPVEIFDNVQLALSRYGWNTSPKTFTVLDRVWDRSMGVIKLTLKETSAAIYTPDAAFLPQGYALNTALPNPWSINPPGTLTVSSGTAELVVSADGTIIPRVRVSWSAIADQRISNGGQIEIQWAVVTTGTWRSILVNGATTEVFITGVVEGMAILVRARAKTALASSDWGVQQVHVVVGKTQPPGPATGVSVTQELVFFRSPPDLDLAGVRIRSLPGVASTGVFSRGTDVIDGLVRSSPARMERKLYGVQTIIVVAEDTSGNQSDPAYAVLDFGQPDLSSALWTRVFADEGFPGTYTACSLSGGSVLAAVDPASNLYMLDNLYGEPDVYATLYQAMTWQTGLVISPYAGTLALTSTLAGNAPTVEYRVSGDTITDLYASADLYAVADLYGPPAQWSLWPGALQVQRATPIEYRITIGASAGQGSISVFTPSLIMDVKDQTFTNIIVDAAGTRLTPSTGTPSRNWVGAVRSVYGWPAVDGSGAIAGRALDYSPVLGPLVQFVDNTGTPVTAKGTVKVEGFSDE